MQVGSVLSELPETRMLHSGLLFNLDHTYQIAKMNREFLFGNILCEYKLSLWLTDPVISIFLWVNVEIWNIYVFSQNGFHQVNKKLLSIKRDQHENIIRWFLRKYKKFKGICSYNLLVQMRVQYGTQSTKYVIKKLTL